LLSPADASLALAWHAAEVPLAAVLAEVRRAASRLRRGGPLVRGAAELPLSLQVIAQSVEAKARRRPKLPAPGEATGLREQLRAAARAPGLAARAAWVSLADAADELFTQEGEEGYWAAAVRALKASLRELPRTAVLQAGSALRARLAPRPRGMPRRRYQRSLQLMLLSATSERLGVPPRPFLL
jgi:hypothetical protein